jgi:hypothetical protein
MTSPPIIEPPARSTFVTVLAWIFIVLSGFTTPIAALQNIMMFVLFRPEAQKAAVAGSAGAPMPPGVSFAFEHIHLFFLAFLVLSALTLVASIGLLKRRNWARLVFVGLMTVGIVYQVAGVAFQWAFLSDAPSAGQDSPEFRMMWQLMGVVTVVFAVVLCGLCGWIMYRLVSQGIRREFS